MTETTSAAEALYRFFGTFPGFDDAHPLGFEAELPPRRRLPGTGEDGTAAREPSLGDGGFSAVFSMEPTLTWVRRYIHGGGCVRGACTVSARGSDADGRQRREMAAFFSALADYVTEQGKRYSVGDRVYTVTPAAHPARLRLTEDGAVWELRCSVEITDQ